MFVAWCKLNLLMFVFIKQKAEFTSVNKHNTFGRLTNNYKSVRSHERKKKFHVENVFVFLNFYNSGAQWWFWWVETCSTLYNIKVLCLYTSFVFQVTLNDGLLGCRLRLCIMRLVSGIHKLEPPQREHEASTLQRPLQVLSTTVHNVQLTWFPGLDIPTCCACCSVCVGLWFVANIPIFMFSWLLSVAWRLERGLWPLNVA
jgi:hypothetical protein